MVRLDGMRVTILATDGFEESELVDPLNALRDFGAQVDVILTHSNTIQGFRHFEKGTAVKVDRTLHDAKPDEYDALVLPGGANNADGCEQSRWPRSSCVPSTVPVNPSRSSATRLGCSFRRVSFAVAR